MSVNAALQWMTAVEAAEALGLNVRTFRRRATDIGIRKRPWGVMRYFRPDVEQAARDQLAQANGTQSS
jgi:hypothetical protein